MKSAKEWSVTKGGLPLAAAVGGLLLLRGLKGSSDQGIDERVTRQEAKRDFEASRFAEVDSSLRGGNTMDPGNAMMRQNTASSNSYPGDWYFDKYSEACGQLMAKQAGIGATLVNATKALGSSLKGKGAALTGALKPGLGTKLLVGGTLAAGGIGAMKAGKAVYNYGMAPSEVHVQGGHNAALPNYANQYGVPTLG